MPSAAEPLWTSEEIAAATGGILAGAPFTVGGVSIDTRSLEPGDLFVALGGVRDGHEFVAQAMAAGAAATLVSEPVEGPHILVPETLKALEAMGVAARVRSSALRCAVTGSVGKTTVTQAIAAGLRLAGPAHWSVKSYNNHIGVPLTLARMPQETQRAVFEIGMNHAGEITPLSRMVAPDVVVITTVGPVHIENFPDGEAGVARAKAEIFDGLKPGGVAILPADNPWFHVLREAARRAGAQVQCYGVHPAFEGALHGIAESDSGTVIEGALHGEWFRLSLKQSGAHWGLNSLAILLALRAMQTPMEHAMRALATFEPLEGRGLVRQIGGFTLIDESYNANPLSMGSAIRSLGVRPAKGRRIAVLTDMLELGDDASNLHARLVVDLSEAAIDLVFCAGPLMKSLWDNLPSTRQGGYAGSAEALAAEVVSAVRPGDVVMVKGSNGSKAHLIAAALMRANAPAEGG